MSRYCPLEVDVIETKSGLLDTTLRSPQQIGAAPPCLVKELDLWVISGMLMTMRFRCTGDSDLTRGLVEQPRLKQGVKVLAANGWSGY